MTIASSNVVYLLYTERLNNSHITQHLNNMLSQWLNLSCRATSNHKRYVPTHFINSSQRRKSKRFWISLFSKFYRSTSKHRKMSTLRMMISSKKVRKNCLQMHFLWANITYNFLFYSFKSFEKMFLYLFWFFWRWRTIPGWCCERAWELRIRHCNEHCWVDSPSIPINLSESSLWTHQIVTCK